MQSGIFLCDKSDITNHLILRDSKEGKVVVVEKCI